MPYTIRQQANGDFCVYKEDGGEALGCHPSHAAAQRQIEAIYANEHKAYLSAESRIYKDYPSDALRLMMIVTSNAYMDREDEIITEQALNEYVEACWKEGDFVGDNPLLVWHGGDPIGDIIYAEMSGPFLIEIARERPNRLVNLARVGEAPMRAMVKSVWDGLQTEAELGASHEFAFVVTDRMAGVYQHIVKTETSVLPRLAAANILTDGEILKEVTWEQ